MKVVWKYEVPLQARFVVHMPVGAEILRVASGEGQPTETGVALWALADTETERIHRKFRLCMTGESLDDVTEADEEYAYVGSFAVGDKSIVFHLFAEVA